MLSLRVLFINIHFLYTNYLSARKLLINAIQKDQISYVKKTIH